MLKFAIITAALLASTTAAQAQPTSAGGQLQQIPPAPDIPKPMPDIKIEPSVVEPDSGPAGASIRVDSLRVTGATLFDEQTLLAVSGFQAGSELTLPQMRALAARISTYYHERGYFLAQTYVPVQDVQSGTITITVIEGRYGEIGLQNATTLHDGIANDVLHGLDRGDIVESAPLERRLLLLSDMPGVLVKSTLSPGTEVGTSDLVVDLMPGRRITGSVEADNGGNRYTGEYRLGGSVNFNNPTGHGDQLSLRVLASTGGLAYGRVAYQAPVGNLTLGASYARIRYQLGREFDRLDADGTADIVSLYASYPVIRSRDTNLYALASVDAKWFEDNIGLVSSRSHKRSHVATIGYAGDSQDNFGGGGWMTVSGGLSVGELDIRTPVERAADALTARTDGGFAKFEYAAARLQTVSGPLSVYGWIRGQLAFDNLDTSEKMELGGAYGVRAYPEGEAYGDEGYIATAEVRLQLDQWAGDLPGELQAFAFVDVGAVDYAHDPWFVGPNRSHRSGYGAGLSWAGPDGLLIKASYAHRLGNEAVTSGPDRSGRFWFQIVKLF